MAFIRLWLDDLRPAPKGWLWVKTSQEALAYYRLNPIEAISFDHDLGGEDTAMPVARAIEEMAALHGKQPPAWSIHSANPVGRKNLKAALESADKHWREQQKRMAEGLETVLRKHGLQ